MEFRVLGPVQLISGADGVALGSGKQVALLCCLLMAGGEIVSRDRLVDALWGDQPPPTAGNALQVHVHALRRRLGPDRIVTEGPGYRLHLEPDELDLGRFELLVARGRSEFAGGDVEAAASTLRDALALWRGPAFEDVRYEAFAQADIARLEELRLVVLEDRIDADLARGHHHDLVPELEALVSEHGNRERLSGQLMLALYRSGQQAAALAVFAQARETLADELGLEPGPGLQELQRAILRQDATLRSEPPELQARRHLPAPDTSLVGRTAELAELAELVRGGARLVTLTGAGGIGKTRLALQAGYELAEAFADGVYFVDLAHLADPDLVADVIASALGQGGQRDEAPLATVQAFLSGRRTLLLLDNFEVVDSAAPLVSELLRAAPGLAVLVTSRSPLRLSGEHQYRVDPLPLADAVKLFATRARAVAPSFRRPSEETEEVARLCQRLDCLPLAIELAAARTREYAPDELLESVPGSLELASAGTRDLPARQRTLRATIDWSYRLLAPDEQTLFARLAVFVGGFTADGVVAVCGADRAALSSLVGNSLVQERVGAGGAVRWSMLETVREYAIELLEGSAESWSFRHRHSEHYASFAEAIEQAHSESRSDTAWQELEAEHDNFRAALDWSRDEKAIELQLRLVGALAYFWATSDHLREGRARIDEALRHASEAPVPLRAKALVAASLLAHSPGDYEAMREYAEASLELFRSLGDERWTAVALNRLGIALSNLGDIDGGILCHEESASISRKLDDGIRLCASLNNLGYCLLQRHQYDRARVLCEEGLAVSRKIGHRNGESVLLGNLGIAALLERNHSDALGFFRQALDVDKELGYEEGVIYGLAGFAAALSATIDAADAALLVGAVDGAALALGVELEPLEDEVHRQLTETLKDTLGPDRFAEAHAAGEQLSLDDAVAYALRAVESEETVTGQAPG
jgi:predicted ATPase/DNA-binding SARP family transcriptional activator